MGGTEGSLELSFSETVTGRTAAFFEIEAQVIGFDLAVSTGVLEEVTGVMGGGSLSRRLSDLTDTVGVESGGVNTPIVAMEAGVPITDGSMWVGKGSNSLI